MAARRFGWLLVAALLLAGCDGGSTATGSPDGDQARPTGGVPAEVASPLADCAGLDAPPGDAAAEPAEAGAGEPLPALELPCFTGGEPVALADLRGPAVVNLWASWCPPCREELPELQQYADRMAGRVHLLGVVTEDRAAGAAAFAEAAGVSFPAVDDREGQLWAEVGAAALPVTLFVDGAGEVVYVHRAGALDEPALAELVSEHLGVAP